MLGRLVVDAVRPATPTGVFPAKGTRGEEVVVSADIFRDGHDVLAARVRWRGPGDRKWKSVPMVLRDNDRWEGSFTPEEVGRHEFSVVAWTNHVATWHRESLIKLNAGDDISLELEEGSRFLSKLRPHKAIRKALEALEDRKLPFEKRLAAVSDEVLARASSEPTEDATASEVRTLWVDRPLAQFGAWYEMFPRSEGGFKGASKRLHAIADMGFDIVYLPPIHPIGLTARKGPNNSIESLPGDPGSPWAIGSVDGGHTAIHSELGSFDDFADFLAEARSLGLEVALDYALQCSPDHPWVKDHPEWFHRRPDGSIKYAENPPKKYQDIYPINFWPEENRQGLWDACREILDFWIERGVRIFRVDNPHTKPIAFWAWLLADIQSRHPDVIFLSEAFTRPKMMAKLAEVGFTQSYTYFTWRNSKQEITDYVNEVANGPASDYFRPNFWTNTPDILSGPLRSGGPSAYRMRLVLASTMVPSYGMYSGFELFENEPASASNEEYLDSEKYEIKARDWNREDSLAPFITRINRIRKRHICFSKLNNIRFHYSNSDQIIVYSKHHGDDIVLVVVNLDPYNVIEATIWLELWVLGIGDESPFEAHDELTGKTYKWKGNTQYIRLDPSVNPAHILHLRPIERPREEKKAVFEPSELWKG